MPQSTRVTLPKRAPRRPAGNKHCPNTNAANYAVAGSNGTTTGDQAPVTHTAAYGTRPSLLRPFGIVGYDGLEPAPLAALATEEPLLLVSEHGAAKTLLLVRIAEALGLELRHNNASLLQFDDLAGFPTPRSPTASRTSCRSPATPICLTTIGAA